MSLTYRTKAEADQLMVWLSGDVDENADGPLAALAQAMAGRKSTLDLDAITTINSYGMMCLTRFLDALSPTTTYAFARCRAAFLNCVALVPNFCRRGRIASFVYTCACFQCSHETETLYTATDPALATLADAHDCPACGQAGGLLPDVDMQEIRNRFAA